MRAPKFWRRESSPEAALLAPLAAIYGRVAALRMRATRPLAPVPALYVGNFVVGGAGKTPMAALVCEILRHRGGAPAVLSRGYGGSLSRAEPILVDLQRHDAAQVGDEPILLAQIAPVVIGSDRAASAALAVRAGADALVLDDGFQSRAFRAPGLILADGKVGIGNGRVLPVGPLRAPMAAQWEFVSALVVLGEGAPGRALASEAVRRNIPVFPGRLAPEPGAAAKISGASVYAFAGIGRPEKFFETLEEIGARILGRRGYPDHHPYSTEDLGDLFAAARRTKAELIVTTEKDMARLRSLKNPESALGRVAVLPVRVRLEDEPGFAAWLSLALGP
jgi:tetraacyldisaccharide 4'-kinase